MLAPDVVPANERKTAALQRLVPIQLVPAAYVEFVQKWKTIALQLPLGMRLVRAADAGPVQKQKTTLLELPPRTQPDHARIDVAVQGWEKVALQPALGMQLELAAGAWLVQKKAGSEPATEIELGQECKVALEWEPSGLWKSG